MSGEMSRIQEASCKDTDLRAVVLGWHKAGKTSLINTILGSSVAVAVSGQCVKKEGYVRGRRVTLVDTPGWWKSLSIRDSPELSKQAIMRSVSMCPPGPQVFLLVIETGVSFKEKYMEPLVQRLELLSERIWRYTIVLFTGGDALTDTTIEQHIQNDGETLQRLLKKCGNRYHVIDNINKDDGSQVEELFGKIENVVRQNDGRSFELDVKVLQELQGKWKEVQSRASAWQSRVLEERSLIKDKVGKEKESIQTSETSGSESEVDSAQKFGIKEQLLSLLEREWSRQEAMVMDNVHEILLKPSQVREASSEVGEDKIKESVAKVEWWLSDCKDEKHTCSDDEILDDSSTAVC